MNAPIPPLGSVEPPSHTDPIPQPDVGGRLCLDPTQRRMQQRLRNRLMAIALLAALAATLPACQSSTPDVSVTLRTNPNWGTLMFDIQAETDNVQVSQVVINRGHCTLPAGTALDLKRTVELQLGQTWRGYSPECAIRHVKEMEVTTGKGTFVFRF